MITLVLSLPPKQLSPNCQLHYMARARLFKRYKMEAQLVTLNEINRLKIHDPFERLTITPIFYHRQKRVRDGDNALASLKAAFDGIAKAGLVKNDSRIKYMPVEFRIDKDRPRVELRVELS